MFLIEDGKAKFQAIKTGLLGELSLEVVAGLKGGETLITGPFKSLRTLKPGDAVKVEEKKKDGAEAVVGRTRTAMMQTGDLPREAVQAIRAPTGCAASSPCSASSSAWPPWSAWSPSSPGSTAGCRTR